MRILLVEDNPALATALIKALTKEGFDLVHSLQGRSAGLLAESHKPDVIILDLGLPDVDGLEVLKEVKAQQPSLAVMLLTARDTLDDKVLGFATGADDYLAKPFEMLELIARLRAIERRLHNSVDNLLCVGDVTLSVTEHKVTRDLDEVELSRKEYVLLRTLMAGANRIITRSTLERHLFEWSDDVSSNALEVHIHNLRKKLGKEFIQTVRGVGYTIKKV